MIKSTGKIIFDPFPKMGGNVMFKPFWAIVVINGDIDNYYRWLLEKKYGLLNWMSITEDGNKDQSLKLGLKLQQPAWGAHISFIRGEAFQTPYYKLQQGIDLFFRKYPQQKKGRINVTNIYNFLLQEEFITLEDHQRWLAAREKYHLQEVNFEHELTPNTVKNKAAHWWLRVKAESLKDIRQDIGYKREGYWGLHLTLGSPTPNCEDYSLSLSKKEIYGK